MMTTSVKWFRKKIQTHGLLWQMLTYVYLEGEYMGNYSTVLSVLQYVLKCS